MKLQDSKGMGADTAQRVLAIITESEVAILRISQDPVNDLHRRPVMEIVLLS